MASTQIAFDIFARDRASGVFAKLGASAENIQQKFGRTGATLDKLGQKAGKALAGGFLVAGAAAVKFADDAASLEASAATAAQIFGEEAVPAIEKFAAEAASKLGQSKQTAIDAANGFATFGKSAGLAGKDLVGFSTDMVTLASDLAAFRDTSPEEAIEAISAALRGESEPIRKYGVLLDEATLKARAMELGISDGTKALTPQQKVLAAQAEILAQTTDAQGQYARESDSLQARQQKLKATLANMRAELGEKVLPAMLALAGAAQKAVDWINENQRIVGITVGVFAGFAAVLWTASAAMRAWLIITNLANAAGKAWAATQWVLNAALTANPIGLVVVAVAALVGAFVLAYKKSETFRKIVNAAFAKVKAVVGSVVGWFKSAVPAAFSTAAEKASAFRKVVVSRFTAAVNFVKSIPDKILSALGNLKTLLIDAGKQVIQGLIDGIAAKVGALKNKLTSITKIIPDWKGPKEKDKRLLRPAGVAIMEGLIKGIESRNVKLKTVLSKLTDFIKNQNSKIRNLIGQRRQMVDQFGGFTSSVFGADFGGPEGTDVPTAQAMVEWQRAQAERAKKFALDVQTLIKRGLSRDLIRQLASSGESGMAQISALAAGSKADVVALNAANAATQAALRAAGLAAGGALYDRQIREAKKDRDAARAVVKKIDALVGKLDKVEVVIRLEDGKIIHQKLLKRKRDTGKKLGLD